MKLHLFTWQRAVLILAVLVVFGLVLASVARLRAAPPASPALCCQASRSDVQAIRTSVVAALAQAPQPLGSARADWRVLSVYQQGGWAYAFVKSYAAGAALAGESAVVLAQRTATGWQAILPQDAAAYDQALAALPEGLIPMAARPLLAQPLSAAAQVRSAAAAYFSGFYLPWPAGQAAYVYWHWYPALDFTIGAPTAGDAIRAAKPGTAVFVKDSSTVECGDPPPSWTCWMYANAIVIQSGPNEYAWYLHLQAHSIPAWLQEGALVPAGADIGLEGQTGWASSPHLHFMVSTWYHCCEGSGDWRFPTWPLGTTWGVDFYEYTWSQMPYMAVSQNGSPAPTSPAAPSTPAAPTPQAPAQPTAAPANPTPVAAISTCSNPYVVRPGDYLIRIASNCNVNEQALVAANPSLNSNLISVGQLLNLPSLGGRPGEAAVTPTAPPAAATPASQPARGGCVGSHIVIPGESLYVIGEACGFSWQQMATANDIGYPYIIYAGQTLQYP